MSASVKERPAAGGPIQSFFQPEGAPRLPMIDRGEGIYLWDTDGNRTIDLSSGPIACNIGHGNARVLEAMVAQARKIAFAAPAQFENAPAIALADLVTSLAGPGLERAFFVSGGSEAIESAIKLARQYAVATGQESRWKVIGRDPGYHGATIGRAVGGRRRERRAPVRRDGADDAESARPVQLPRAGEPHRRDLGRRRRRGARAGDPARGPRKRARLHHGAGRRRRDRRAGGARRLLPPRARDLHEARRAAHP